MKVLFPNLKVFVAATAMCGLFGPVFAQDARLDPLFERLLNVSPEDAGLIEDKIQLEWSKSGSTAMDLLLRHARKALDAGDPKGALIHLTALTDHAPDFAEGWHLTAIAHFHRDELGLALENLRRTLAIEPRHYNAMAGLIAILEATDQPTRALDIARIIRSIHPHFEDLSTVIDRLEGKTAGQSL